MSEELKTLKFFTFVRYNTGKLINSKSSEKSKESKYIQEANKIVARLLESKLNPKERQKVNSSFGNWYATPDDKDILYLVLTTSDYSERHAYSFIRSFQEELGKIGDYSNEDDLTLRYNMKVPMTELFKKYQDPAQFDKLSQAQDQVEMVKIQMNQNIQKVVQNGESLRKVEDKSNDLNKNSKKFLNQAKELERIMFWRKVKLNVIIALIIIAVLCIIILPFVIETTALSSAIGGGSSKNKEKSNIALNTETTDLVEEQDGSLSQDQQQQQQNYKQFLRQQPIKQKQAEND